MEADGLEVGEEALAPPAEEVLLGSDESGDADPKQGERDERANGDSEQALAQGHGGYHFSAGGVRGQSGLGALSPSEGS